MNVNEIDAASVRADDAAPAIAPMFLTRWSPRAMAGQPLSTAELNALIEAARWAPSCFNAQPWRFACSVPGTPGFDELFATLVEGNQAWAAGAGALIAVVSRTRYERNDNPAATHSFDTGAAWMSLALQAQHMGLVAHGMQGFDAQAARQLLNVPDVYDLPAIIAVGHPGEVENLPEAYREREVPSQRKALDEILFTDNFRDLEA